MDRLWDYHGLRRRCKPAPVCAIIPANRCLLGATRIERDLT